LKLKAVETRSVQIEATLKEIGYKLFVEQILDGNAEGRAMIGDLKQYAERRRNQGKGRSGQGRTRQEEARSRANLAAVKPVAAAPSVAHTAELQKELQLASRSDRAERESENFEAKLAKTQKIVEAYEDKLNKTEEALAKAIETQEELSAQLYAERKLTNNPKAGKIRSVIESSNVRSTGQVDQLVEKFREPVRDPEDLAAVRARVRATDSGRSRAAPPSTKKPGRRRHDKRARTDWQELGSRQRTSSPLRGS
jgi:hypothetical protein